MVERFIQINQKLPVYILAVLLCETKISQALNYVDFLKVSFVWHVLRPK